MRARFIKKLLLSQRPFSISSYFKWRLFTFSSYMGILFQQPKIKAKSSVRHFITNAHLLSILSLSSPTVTSRAARDTDVPATSAWPGKGSSIQVPQEKTAHRKIPLLLPVTYEGTIIMKVTMFPKQQRLSITLWEVYLFLAGVES